MKAEASYYPVSLRPTTGFRPPEDASKPLIMIGPGTGVAPFRGFLQHRRAQAAAGAALGESWLFFGNWRAEWDYLYQEDFEGFAEDKTLSHLELAWSREGSEKVRRFDRCDKFIAAALVAVTTSCRIVRMCASLQSSQADITWSGLCRCTCSTR
jgi:ferredoxin-NADP reductase